LENNTNLFLQLGKKYDIISPMEMNKAEFFFKEAGEPISWGESFLGRAGPFVRTRQLTS